MFFLKYKWTSALYEKSNKTSLVCRKFLQNTMEANIPTVENERPYSHANNE